MSCRTLSAAIVSARTRLSANATSEGILGLRLWQTMIMSNSSATELMPAGQRRVGRARQHVALADDLEEVRRVAAAGALAVVGVDRPAVERGDGVLDVAGLVQRVGVDRDRDVELVGDGQAGPDRRRGRAVVLVDLEARAPATICSTSGAWPVQLPLP